VHGVRDLPDRLPADRRLLTEAFRERGWRTFGIWSGPNLHPWFGFDRGFERYVDCSTSAVPDPDSVFGLSSDGRWNDVRHLHESSHRGVTGPAILAAFSDFASKLGDERFFAFVHMWDVHYDYNAPEEFDVFYPGYDGPIDGQDFQALAASRVRLTQSDLWRLLSLYDAEIRYVDHQIATMLSLLDARGRLADTLVVVTSDHGEEFLEHGALGHKSTLYEEVLHVPLLWRLPGRIAPARRHGGLVSLLDVAPTIADFCDVPFPSRHGRSLRGILESGRGDPGVRPVPLELSIRPLHLEFRGLHAGDHKVLRHVTADSIQLFDLVADPLEHAARSGADLAPDDPRVARAFRTWAELDAEAATLLPVEAGELPRGLAEDLTKAGYLGEAPSEDR
jgi:arylsulfatase A-like enzyme